MNMLRRIGAACVLTSDPALIKDAAKLILPGVGAFDEGMRNLQRLRLIEPLGEAVFNNGASLLGICLGMQLLGAGSAEGVENGLGWLPFRCVRFGDDRSSNGRTLKVPHMGWNTLKAQRSHPILSSVTDDSRFYFVHSYYCPAEAGDVCLATANYGVEFAAVVGDKGITGVQFHPEKSHKYGMRLLSDFIRAEP